MPHYVFSKGGGLKKLKPTLLLTGGAGFVGHHLVEGILKQTDWNVIILDSLNYAGNLNRLTDIEIFEREKARVKFVFHDLRAEISETTHKMIGEVDYVWHLSSETSVDKSLQDSRPFVLSNVLGTANLLEYLRKYQPNLKKYIGFNTDECFGPVLEEGVYKTETDKFYPSNPYAASKAGQWCLEYSFAHAFGMPIVMCHSMNLIGERQHAEKFVPKTVKALLEGEKVILHQSNGRFSSRCWIHAREVLNALLFLTEKGEPKETYNIVGQEKTVFEIANLICQIINERGLLKKDYQVVDAHSQRPGHDLRYAISGEKLEKMGFKFTLDFEESFRKMILWMIKPENRKWL